MSSKNSDFETILKEDGVLTFTNVGYSMYPLIEQHKDILTIVTLEREPKRYDVVLYKDKEHHYVLHRILKVKKDKIILAGDHNHFKDKPIQKEEILGILKSIHKADGRIIEMEKEKKPFFKVHFFYLKAFGYLLVRVPKRIFHKHEKAK